MNIKLIRNAMVIMVIITVISLMGKTSAHDIRSAQMHFEPNHATHLFLER